MNAPFFSKLCAQKYKVQFVENKYNIYYLNMNGFTKLDYGVISTIYLYFI